MSETDDILGKYTLLKDTMENSSEIYCHVSQTGFFYTIHGSKQDTVLFCGDRWSGFAGNGMGFNVWVPLSFTEDGIPIFNDISQFTLNAETGEFEIDQLHPLVNDATSLWHWAKWLTGWTSVPAVTDCVFGN